MLTLNHISGGYLRKPIVEDIHFQVDYGEIVALVGLNGAGKSTTLRLITGTLRPMSGDITLNGHEWLKERGSMAHIPDTPQLYPNLTIKEHLDFIMRLYPNSSVDYLNKQLERYSLLPHLEKYPYALSKGTQQKVSILLALLTNPHYLIVDEPFMGLDPIGLSLFLEDLHQLKEKGTAILLSTHLLAIAEDLCDRVVIINKGKQLKYNGNPSIHLKEMKAGSLQSVFFSMIGEK
ncbi:ABC-2 type transport system ATP-binding protein [Alkalihalobacillus xiaoxiensis]|uniref:ABC-2 type transport system ATP-binding protein n=1 Tax=Shouchella xiaoxiensis TaxID=766895 RepID=A0ABS2SPB3_9BACI|nr:ABC transporter ATP-binding protein [Shouchella xiaoxiensis]MBM7837364.1 ABC-2 type transport system ATP-binding protein [Shouchella xiaoxiensis]